jgi:hypothetical protein
MTDLKDRGAGAPEIEITPAMIEAAGECLRAYMEEEAPSYSESLYLAEKMLWAAFHGRTPSANTPCKLMKSLD